MAWRDSNVWKRGSRWRLSHTNGEWMISTSHKNKTLALKEGRRMLHEGRTKQLNIFKGDGTWHSSEVYYQDCTTKETLFPNGRTTHDYY